MIALSTNFQMTLVLVSQTRDDYQKATIAQKACICKLGLESDKGSGALRAQEPLQEMSFWNQTWALESQSLLIHRQV